MLLGTLGASLLGDLLIGKGAMAKSISEETKLMSQGWGICRAGKRKGVNRAGEGIVRSGSGNNNNNNKMDF